jgi:hypothetical protein
MNTKRMQRTQMLIVICVLFVLMAMMIPTQTVAIP